MRALGLATAVAAIAGFGIMWIAARALGTEGYADFAAYWGFFLAAAGFLDGLQQETARAVSLRAEAAGTSSTSPSPTVTPTAGTSSWAAAWRVGGGAALGVGCVSALFMPALVGATEAPLALVLLAASLGSYALQTWWLGVLSGTRRWGRYAGLVAADSLVRLLLAAVAWRLGWGLEAFLVVTVLGAWCWLFFLTRGPHPRAQVRGVLPAMCGAGANALLVVGYPALAKLALGDAASLSATLLALTLLRAPIVIPLQRFHTAIIVHFSGGGSRWRIIAAVLALGTVEVLGVLAVGPELIGWLFGSDFALPRAELAGLVSACTATGLLIVSGLHALAHSQHRRYAAGWLTAAAVAFGVLFLPGTPIWVSVLAGALAGIVIHR